VPLKKISGKEFRAIKIADRKANTEYTKKSIQFSTGILIEGEVSNV
jgi:hypothetical protein